MAEAEWYKNPYTLFGAAAGVAIAIPAGIALAPPVMAGLGVIGGAVALTALGAGVIATTMAIGKHIDEAIEANNSPETIKKILDRTEDGYTDAKKIKDIERIAKAKRDNIFLKLFDHQSSQAIGDLYLGALDRKVPNQEGEGEEYEDKKIIAGLKVVNKLDQLRSGQSESTDDSEFINKLDQLKESKKLWLNYHVGQKITENSKIFSDGVDDVKTVDVKSFFDILAKALDTAARHAPAPADGGDSALGGGGVAAGAAGAAAAPDPAPVAGAGDGAAPALAAAAPVLGGVDGGAAAAGGAAGGGAAAADAREAKIREDFTNSGNNVFSIIYQYKVSMGLDILSNTSKTDDYKIQQLTQLMSINLRGDNKDEIENLISDFTKIDAKAPEGTIDTKTPWAKALRIFAQAILDDTSPNVTIQDRILALEAYLKELKSGVSNVSSTQQIRQSNNFLIINSTRKSAGDFLKRISEVSAGADGKKDISSIKAFDAAAAAAAEAAAAAAAAAAAREAKIRQDFSTEATAETFYQTLYKYRLAIARDILESGPDDEKLIKLETLFSYAVRRTTLEDRRNDFVNWFTASHFPAPDITDIKTPLSAGNLRTFANAILDDKDVAPDVKITALNSHIRELLDLKTTDATNTALNFYKEDSTDALKIQLLRDTAKTFLSDYASTNSTSFESAYAKTLTPAPAPAPAPSAAPAAAAAAASAAASASAAAGLGPP